MARPRGRGACGADHAAQTRRRRRRRSRRRSLTPVPSLYGAAGEGRSPWRVERGTKTKALGPSSPATRTLVGRAVTVLIESRGRSRCADASCPKAPDPDASAPDAPPRDFPEWPRQPVSRPGRPGRNNGQRQDRPLAGARRRAARQRAGERDRLRRFPARCTGGMDIGTARSPRRNARWSRITASTSWIPTSRSASLTTRPVPPRRWRASPNGAQSPCWSEARASISVRGPWTRRRGAALGPRRARSVEARLARRDCPRLVGELRELAPTRAAAVDLRNPRRVVRALEIARLTGETRHCPQPRGYGGPVLWLGVRVERRSCASGSIPRALGPVRTAGLGEETPPLGRPLLAALASFSLVLGYAESLALIEGR